MPARGGPTAAAAERHRQAETSRAAVDRPGGVPVSPGPGAAWRRLEGQTGFELWSALVKPHRLSLIWAVMNATEASHPVPAPALCALVPACGGQACAALLATRDADAIKSHAQRHFVKLCLCGKALPAKVAESGSGYTLSGKPLDPGSAGAAQNGFKLELLARECSTALQKVQKVAK